jgi:HAD superfamily hydrolase (TIGR01509 family)
MSLEALIFDLDGTLVDTEELHRRAFNQAFQEFDLGWNWGLDLYADLLAVSGGADRIGHYIDRLALSPAEKVELRRLVPALHRAKTRILGELIAAGTARPRAGVARLLREARAAGLRVGVVASSAAANAWPLLTAALGPDLATGVTALVSAEQVARRKPAPDLYELALASLRVPAGACVALEDSANGVAAAKAAGLYTVATPSRWTIRQDFARADLLIPSLGDPETPLGPEAERVLGAPWLDLALLRRRFAAPRLLKV